VSSALLPPVSERVRVSLRVSRTFDAALDAEMRRRQARGMVGGGSLPELMTVAVADLAQREVDEVRRAFRRALVACDAGSEVHLQPRVSDDIATYVDAMSSLLKRRLHERRASRRAVLLTALCELLDQGVGNPHATR
jgi:hypothetical protein